MTNFETWIMTLRVSDWLTVTWTAFAILTVFFGKPSPTNISKTIRSCIFRELTRNSVVEGEGGYHPDIPSWLVKTVFCIVDTGSCLGILPQTTMKNCSFRELTMNAVVEGVGGWTATSVGGSPGRLVPNGVPRDPTLQLSTLQLPLSTLQLSTLQLPP